MLHITLWKLMLMLHIKQSICLVLTNFLSTSFLMFLITFEEISTTQHCLYNSGKGRCTRYPWSNDMFFFGIAYLLFVMKIENAVCTFFQNSELLFIIEMIFDIMNIQNNQSLEFEWIPMLAPLRSVNDWRFSWLHIFFLKSFQDWLNSVQQCHGNFTKDAGQKMFILWQTYERLKISVN